MKACDNMLKKKNNNDKKKKVKVNKINNDKKKRKNTKIKTFLKKIKSNIFKIRLFENDGKSMYSFKEVFIIMLFSLGLGFACCFSFVMIFNNGRDYKTLTSDFKKLVDTYYAIKDNYYGELDNGVLVDAAVEGMVGAVGDIYTSYSDAESTDSFMQTVSGVYEGIGCTVAMGINGEIIVVDMFKDSPSMEAGLEIGDIIISVDGTDYSDKTSTDVANYIKNNNNSEVSLLVLRNGEEIDIVVKRKKIEIPYVTSELLERNNKKIGYIDVSLFSSVANEQFKKELIKLEDNDIDSLIIDVRGNSGGYLSSVTDIINMFLKKGNIIYKLEDKNGVVEKKDNSKEKRDYPVAVLVNSGSASASEILAAAIKESYGGFVVGTNTFGKGTVQQTTTLPDGSMVKYTVQNWLTPNGNWINDVGLEPTDIIELGEEYLENPINDNDSQLQKAIELVSK